MGSLWIERVGCTKSRKSNPVMLMPPICYGSIYVPPKGMLKSQPPQPPQSVNLTLCGKRVFAYNQIMKRSIRASPDSVWVVSLWAKGNAVPTHGFDGHVRTKTHQEKAEITVMQLQAREPQGLTASITCWRRQGRILSYSFRGSTAIPGSLILTH